MSKAAELAKWGEVSTNGQVSGRRNIVINGAMNVAQRATSVADVGASQGYFCTDRFKSTFVGTAARYTVSQDSDAPAGFSKCLKYDVTTADTSVAADEFHAITYQVEGQDISHFEWGTSDAKQCTFSFYAKATTAQTVVVNFIRVTSGTSRSLSKAFSITTSYQRFTFTLPADTGGSAQVETNGLGLSIHIGLGAGSNYTGGITGVAGVGSQLEVGSVATPFEHRSFGEELALCQRYWYQSADNLAGGVGQGGMWFGENINTTECYGPGNNFPVNMRATPTITIYDNAGTAGAAHTLGTADVAGITVGNISNRGFSKLSKTSGLTDERQMGAQFTADIEL
jgi:hypothetical protein